MWTTSRGRISQLSSGTHCGYQKAPTLEAIASQSNYEVAVVIGNRALSDMWKVYMRRSNSESRSVIASGTGKSMDITIPPATDGQPEKVELTVQLFKSNEPYGQMSDAVYVTVSP